MFSSGVFYFKPPCTCKVNRGVVGRGRGGTASPSFFDRGTRPPLPHFFGLKFVQKLVHCCNWLLTEKLRKIISVGSTVELVFV